MNVLGVLGLPTELITQCLSYCKGSDLAKLSQTCTAFKVITDIDLLWQKTSLREYSCKSLEGWSLSYKQLYAKVLHKYGYLLGLWKDTTSCYGGLVHISYSDGCIKAEEYYPTKDVREPLQKKEIFKIEMSDDDGEVKVTWNPGYCDRQPCDIANQTQEKADNKVAEIRKKWKPGFQPDTPLEQKEMLALLEECSIRGTHPELCMFKWQSHKKIRLTQTLQTLRMSTTCPEERFLPSPGLYKGLYGGHGTELVYLSYDLDKKKAFTRKISGDPNVPAGEVSITADLSKPLVLNEEEQESIRSLKEVEVWKPIELWDAVEGQEPELLGFSNQIPRKQPFVIPREVSAEDEFHLPKYCIARYQGTATVSPTGYRHPQQIPAHFIVFDKTMFGGLWLDLHSFSTFTKVQEKFDSVNLM